MKKRLLLFLFLIALFFPQKAFAHSAGQPPFFKINNAYAGYYPLQVAGITSVSFDVPQDAAQDSYLVNSPIHFVIDTSQMNIPDDLLSRAKFTWDYGDSSGKGSGSQNDHAYEKIGSYVLTIFANYDLSGSDNTQQLLETVFFNVVPNTSYVLPKAVVFVNGRKPVDPLRDIIKLDLNNPLTFDATHAQAGSAQIASYTWDFGDGQTSMEKVTSHQFQLPQFFISPVLRVKDSNGFINDAFVNIQNSGKNDPNTVQTNNGSMKKGSLIFIGIGVVVLVVLFVIVRYLLLRRSNPKP